MSWQKEFEELDKAKHDRESFDCLEKELNDFIKTKAGISRTMVLPATLPLLNNKHPICCFYTVSPTSIGRKTLPEKLSKKLPHYPIPVFLLAQLAVNKNFQKQGLGKVSLINALKYLYKVNTHMPAYAVIVDCLTEDAHTFYAKYGFEVLCEYNGRIRMFLPMKTVEILFKD